MPTLNRIKKGKLQVRLIVSSHYVRYYNGEQWKQADSLVHARIIAHRLGYDGIEIEPQ